MTEWRTVERPSTLSVQPRAQVVGDIPDAHVITVRERRVTVDYPTIIQNNVNTDVIELDLDGEWDDMSVVLVLGPCGGATELAWHGEPVTLPSALAEDTGGIDVSVVGYSADGETRLVTVAAPSLLNVIKSGCTVGEAPADETPDLIGQLVAAGDAANKAAQAANTAATAANGAAGTANAAASAANTAAEAARGNVLKGTLGPAPLPSADDAYATKPRKLTVHGATRQNLWVNPSGTIAGVTFTINDNGSVTVRGTSTGSISLNSGKIYALRPSTKYTVSVDKALSSSDTDPSNGCFFIEQYASSGEIISSGTLYVGYGTTLSTTFTASSELSFVYLGAFAVSGKTFSGTYRVMLNEGSEPKPWCPPGLNSVDELSIVTAGKNLFGISQEFSDLSGLDYTQLYDEGDGWVRAETAAGAIGIHYTNNKMTFMPTTYTVSFEAYANKKVSAAYSYITNTADANIPLVWYGATAPVVTTEKQRVSFQFTLDKEVNGNFLIGVGTANAAGAVFHVRNLQLELGSTATDYEPPAVTTTPIDLDGNTLCSLPDGTHDELTIDATGAVTLTKRVGVATAPTDASGWKFVDGRGEFNVSDTSMPSQETMTLRNMCDKLPVRTAASDPAYAFIATSYGYAKHPSITGTSQAASIAGGATYIYPLAAPETISLPPVTLPTLPAPTVNVWADAEASGAGYAMGPDVELEYERDVTISFNKLQAQISATTVREATNG